ncbi:hypothetical protein OPT61_g7445 [Boeremia exigua]|uniref:Uncharacterized protein n=1 Tax=Boeremia exigua TaxID=749465 RepID=A0ACC2I2R0_9PLEO|nr:hypothetical protein OPT61_g7445 [Boeremia exigua]
MSSWQASSRGAERHMGSEGSSCRVPGFRLPIANADDYAATKYPKIAMVSASMLRFSFFAVFPLLVHAQHNQQTPLFDHHPELIIPLKLSSARTYTFESALDGTKQLSSKAIGEIESYREINSHPQSVLINVPLDPTEVGTMVLDSSAANSVRVKHWMDTPVPGENVLLVYTGVRKGGMISMDAYATHLALETPYISLPSELYDVLVQATNPTSRQHGASYDNIVDCSHLERFPDLVLGLQPEADEGEDDEDIEIRELVIAPKQYVLEVEGGECVLLAQRGRAEVVLGWAAVRGRDIVLDWAGERTGFGW